MNAGKHSLPKIFGGAGAQTNILKSGAVHTLNHDVGGNSQKLEPQSSLQVAAKVRSRKFSDPTRQERLRREELCLTRNSESGAVHTATKIIANTQRRSPQNFLHAAEQVLSRKVSDTTCQENLTREESDKLFFLESGAVHTLCHNIEENHRNWSPKTSSNAGNSSRPKIFRNSPTRRT